MRKIRELTLLLIVAVSMAGLGVFCGLNPGNATVDIDPARCTGCAQCTSVCPVDAVRLTGPKAVIDPTKCTACGRCVESCPVDAIQ